MLGNVLGRFGAVGLGPGRCQIQHGQSPQRDVEFVLDAGKCLEKMLHFVALDGGDQAACCNVGDGHGGGGGGSLDVVSSKLRPGT